MAEAISVEQFLKSATLQYSEYADGRSLPLNLGSKTHATIQVKCGRRLMDYLDKRTDGYVASGLHCILKIDGQTRLRRPDLAVVLGTRKRTSHRTWSGRPTLWSKYDPPRTR